MDKWLAIIKKAADEIREAAADGGADDDEFTARLHEILTPEVQDAVNSFTAWMQFISAITKAYQRV